MSDETQDKDTGFIGESDLDKARRLKGVQTTAIPSYPMMGGGGAVYPGAGGIGQVVGGLPPEMAMAIYGGGVAGGAASGIAAEQVGVSTHDRHAHGTDEEDDESFSDEDLVREVLATAIEKGEEFTLGHLIETMRMVDPDDARVELLLLLLSDLSREPAGPRGALGGVRMLSIARRDETLRELCEDAESMVEELEAEVEAGAALEPEPVGEMPIEVAVEESPQNSTGAQS